VVWEQLYVQLGKCYPVAFLWTAPNPVFTGRGDFPWEDELRRAGQDPDGLRSAPYGLYYDTEQEARREAWLRNRVTGLTLGVGVDVRLSGLPPASDVETRTRVAPVTTEPFSLAAGLSATAPTATGAAAIIGRQ
jgi:hypothetical protein